ncbi:MAG: hypothetical protein HY246_12845 [Proteobacteria bacterium]|nr:hypothetical protein [Pseudomonadota bacterium]
MNRNLIFTTAVMALAACADEPAVYNFYSTSTYDPTYVADAAGRGDTLAVIRHNPFAADRDNSGVLAAMQGQNAGPPLHYTQMQQPSGMSGYQVVVAFGTPPIGRRNMCRDHDAPFGPSPAGRLAATAAFCFGRNMLTEASATGAASDRPEDPRFKRLMNQLLVALFPSNLIYDDCTGNC